MTGLYIHIPFCAKVCDYCDFSVLAAPIRLYEEFIGLLLQELSALKKRNPITWESIETLYLGGGTPSVLPEELLIKLLLWLQNAGIKITELREATMEVNPESCLKERLDIALSFGIRRFSLGVQTFNQNLLNRIGRAHTVESALRALDTLTALRKYHVKVNADLMFSLPGQSIDCFLNDVSYMAKMPLDHISFYGLNVSSRTLLGQRIKKGTFSIDENLYRPMYNGGVQILESAGFHRYEVSNFAKENSTKNESIHNKNYWNRGFYLGAGPGAHSYINNVRFNAPERYSHWKSWVISGCKEDLYEKDILSHHSEIAETIWLSLRQSTGLNLNALKNSLQYTPPLTKISHWVEKNYLKQSGDTLTLQGDGWIFMDEIVKDLMP